MGTKVWILEKFVTREAMVQNLADYEGYFEEAKKQDNEQAIKDFDNLIQKYKAKVEANPDGEWIGFEGNSSYRQFCECAKGAIRRNNDAKFRVVEAEIPSSAKMWLGYKFVKVNEGVLNYLLATK